MLMGKNVGCSQTCPTFPTGEIFVGFSHGNGIVLRLYRSECDGYASNARHSDRQQAQDVMPTPIVNLFQS